MNPRRNSLLRCPALMLVTMPLLAAIIGVLPARGQMVRALVQFTNVWKYDQSGRELGTAWRNRAYNDSEWPAGPGLLGFDATTPFPYLPHGPINTPLTISATVTSYYFRTTFVFDGTTNGLSLIASNLVDDGCVIYLNGLQVGGVRAPSFYNATTSFPGPATEGTLDVVTFTNLNALRAGTNLLAVEVHQTVMPSADAMWGMKLMAFQQTPLAVVKPPQDQIATVGDSVIFEVEAEGGPAFFQWQKDEVNLVNARSSSYTNSAVSLGASGQYRVIVTNAVSSVTSAVATLSVFADIAGPRMLSAIADFGYGSNSILVAFSEPLAVASARTVTNYSLRRFDSSALVPIIDALYSPGVDGHPSVLLRVSGASNPDWVRFGNYVLTASHVSDDDGNAIAPDSQIAVAWPRQTSLLAPDAVWEFHAAAAFDREVFDEEWMAAGYIGSFWWAQGAGAFYSGRLPPSSACFGAFQTATGFQPEPLLFRTAFFWPDTFGPAALLEVSATVDDGMLLFLNGAELWRTNLPAPPTVLNAFSRSIAPVTAPLCLTNFIRVNNLVPGLNWLAAGIAQSPTSDGDTLFGLQLKATTFLPGPLPASPAPTLSIVLAVPGAVQVHWNGAGYALESCTNLTDNLASYPFGPWQEVPGLANPYASQFTDPHRFFRLKKK